MSQTMQPTDVVTVEAVKDSLEILFLVAARNAPLVKIPPDSVGADSTS